MPSLHELQRAFCTAVLSGEADGVAGLIRSDGIPAAQRVQIYRNNTKAGFLATLAATFPVIERLGGEEWFRQSARDYQRRFPSRSGDVQFVADRYAEFLRERFARTPHEYFFDVARLEWAYQEVLTASDSSTLNPSDLGSVAFVDYERLIFVPRPAARLVASVYPILAIWKANQPGATDIDLRLDAGSSRVLVIRRPDCIELREIGAPSAALFAQFERGISLAAAGAAVMTEYPDADLGSALRELITLQSIGGFHLKRHGEIS